MNGPVQAWVQWCQQSDCSTNPVQTPRRPPGDKPHPGPVRPAQSAWKRVRLQADPHRCDHPGGHLLSRQEPHRPWARQLVGPANTRRLAKSGLSHSWARSMRRRRACRV